MWKLIKLFIQLFLLKKKPEHIPYSRALLWLLIVCFIVVTTPINILFSKILIANATIKDVILTPLTVWQSLFSVFIYLLIMFTTIYSLLTYYGLQHRIVQVLNSLLGIEIILSLWFGGISLFPSDQVLFVLMFCCLLIWQFVINIYIFANSLDVHMLRATIFALIYILFQHNVDEFLLVTFMHAR